MQEIRIAAKCAICGTTERLLRCAQCKTIFYCSISHQHVDWPRHKLECRSLAKQKQIYNNNNSHNKILHFQQQVDPTNIETTNTNTSRINLNDSVVDKNRFIKVPITASTTIPAVIRLSNGCQNSTSVMTNVKPLHQQQQPQSDQYMILGTNENEIMNSQAEACNSCKNFRNDNHHPNHNNIHMQASMEQMHIGAENNAGVILAEEQFENLPENNDDANFQGVIHQEMSTQINSNATEFLQQFSNYANNQLEKSSSYQIGRMDENAIGNVNERRYEDLCRNIINDMNEYGLSVVDDFLGIDKGIQILNEVHQMYSAGVFKDGQLVNNSRPDQDLRTIRGDKITWVKGVETNCSNVGYLINQIDNVICRANTMNENGKLGQYKIKERTKAMVACYPGSGSQYVMHVDNPNKDGRVITAIYYLNLDWETKHSGGLLRIFPEHGNTVADIEPIFDRLIFFWSDKRNPHEVQPAHRTRYAITVWYFDANEREAALNRCKNTNISTKTKTYENFTNDNKKSTLTSSSSYTNDLMSSTKKDTTAKTTTTTSSSSERNTTNTNMSSNKMLT